ncbi:MAG: type II toxin-antitoxin system HicA family toxin [Ktedonobacterales bacterium]
MSAVPELTVRDVIRMIRDNGWQPTTEEDEFWQFKHPVQRGKITIVGKKDHLLGPSALLSILRQAHIAQ